ncbi:hypothetical protein MLD38_021505 [Melastoma candidum]|uniref:Uncharacterized protein n=1 Tax=Melastoma candidum TaxID=119954 RepID=A0ACB9QGT5_9MYRT|nr:hypothetical protein MLD38_021505 [Melastoma candidum]
MGRFASMLLERLKNKRPVYVGDSLNRVQWVSMVGIVRSRRWDVQRRNDATSIQDGPANVVRLDGEIHVNRKDPGRVCHHVTNPPEGRGMGRGAGLQLFRETEPVTKEGYRGSDWDLGIMQAVEVAMERLKKGFVVEVLNITQLS